MDLHALAVFALRLLLTGLITNVICRRLSSRSSTTRSSGGSALNSAITAVAPLWYVAECVASCLWTLLTSPLGHDPRSRRDTSDDDDIDSSAETEVEDIECDRDDLKEESDTESELLVSRLDTAAPQIHHQSPITRFASEELDLVRALQLVDGRQEGPDCAQYRYRHPQCFVLFHRTGDAAIRARPPSHHVRCQEMYVATALERMLVLLKMVLDARYYPATAGIMPYWIDTRALRPPFDGEKHFRLSRQGHTNSIDHVRSLGPFTAYSVNSYRIMFRSLHLNKDAVNWWPRKFAAYHVTAFPATNRHPALELGIMALGYRAPFNWSCIHPPLPELPCVETASVAGR